MDFTIFIAFLYYVCDRTQTRSSEMIIQPQPFNSDLINCRDYELNEGIEKLTIFPFVLVIDGLDETRELYFFKMFPTPYIVKRFCFSMQFPFNLYRQLKVKGNFTECSMWRRLHRTSTLTKQLQKDSVDDYTQRGPPPSSVEAIRKQTSPRCISRLALLSLPLIQFVSRKALSVALPSQTITPSCLEKRNKDHDEARTRCQG